MNFKIKQTNYKNIKLIVDNGIKPSIIDSKRGIRKSSQLSIFYWNLIRIKLKGGEIHE